MALGTPWGPFGGFLEGDLKLNIILEGLLFWEGRLGAVLGSFLRFLEVILELILRLFRRPSPQQIEQAKS